MSNQHQVLYPLPEDNSYDCVLLKTVDCHLTRITLLQEQIANEEAALKKLLENHGVDILPS